MSEKSPAGSDGGHATPSPLPARPAAARCAAGCVVAGTERDERRHASFTAAGAELDEIYAFYEAAMENADFTGAAASRTGSPTWNAMQSWSNIDTGRTLSIKYFSERSASPPLITITFAEGTSR
jgi:hypothetical protein